MVGGTVGGVVVVTGAAVVVVVGIVVVVVVGRVSLSKEIDSLCELGVAMKRIVVPATKRSSNPMSHKVRYLILITMALELLDLLHKPICCIQPARFCGGNKDGTSAKRIYPRF